MRHHKTLDLAPGRLVTVREMRVADVRHIFTQLSHSALARAPIQELLGERWPELLALAGDSLTLPEGETLDDLSFSELDQIGAAWWELHQDFFGRIEALVRRLGVDPKRSLSSIAPVSAASSADTPASGTTAGRSS